MSEILASIGADIGAIHIVLLALGIISLVIEMLQPGFGVFGFIGIGLLLTDAVLLADNVSEAVLLIAAIIFIVALLFLIFLILASFGIVPKPFVLSAEVGNGAETLTVRGVEAGDEGITLTRLSPCGKIKLNELTFDAISRGEFIDAGVEITVLEVVGNKITVAKKSIDNQNEIKGEN